MAVTLTNAVAEADVAAAVAKVSPELAYLFENAGISKEIVAKIGTLGIETMEVFAQIEPTITEFRTFASTDIGLDPKAGVPNKVALAKLVGAWEAANTRGKKRREEEAEQRIGDLPRKLPRSSHLDLRRAFATRHRELRDEEAPHPEYLEGKLQQIEDGDFKAERLCDALCLSDDDGSSATGIMLASDGTVKARKTTSVKGSTPTNSEQLRTRLKVMAHAWEYARLKVPKDYLQDFDLSLFSSYADWLLGEKVAGLSLATPGAQLTCKPSWALVLSFDFDFRKQVAWHANHTPGTLKTWFEKTYADETLYQTKLLTPLSLDAGASAARAMFTSTLSSLTSSSSSSVPPPPPAWSATGVSDTVVSQTFPPLPPGTGKGKKAKGKGKGKDNKKGGKGKSGKESNTKIKGQICWRFQRSECDGRCGRQHVCKYCWSSDHGGAKCPQKPAAPNSH